jgi:hypothetical protein
VAEISRFYGVVIAMYFGDHPPAHFHAKHGDRRIKIDIETGAPHGDFPPASLALIEQWRVIHLAELRRNWELVMQGKAPKSIAPLE